MTSTTSASTSNTEQFLAQPPAPLAAHAIRPQGAIDLAGLGKPVMRGPNHILHGILSVCTLGLWFLPWLVIALNNKQVPVRDSNGQPKYDTPDAQTLLLQQILMQQELAS